MGLDDGNKLQSMHGLCEECKENRWKYKCPGCSLRSCSLPCVNSHKKRTSCTGKRDRTHFVPLSQFDDSVLLSDYYLLEEMKRNAEVAQRMRAPLFHRYRLPSHLQFLKKAASNRRVQIRFLSNGMSKREKNRSYCDRRRKTIYWTIEWRFHSTNVVSTDDSVSEDSILSSVLANHLRPGNCPPELKQFRKETLHSLKLLIRKYPGGRHSPYYQLDINSSLKEQLRDVVLLEYPVIDVFLSSHTVDFEIAERKMPGNRRSDAAREVDDDLACAEGVTFKVEEIGEEKLGVSEPIPTRDECENLKVDTSPKSDAFKSSIIELESELFKEFDADESLSDTYSRIMAQMDSDDFFHLGDVLLGSEVQDDAGAIPRFVADVEIEDGEIR